MAMTTMTLGMQAQLVRQQVESLPGHQPHRSAAAPAKAGGDALWWGYYDGVGERGALGVEAAATYYQAIRIDPSNTALVGKSISQVRIYMRDLRCLNDIYLWVSTSLPATVKDVDGVLIPLRNEEINGGDVDNYFCGLPTDVSLPSPYEVTDKGVYVGVTYTVSDVSSNAGLYPIVTTYDDEEVPNALFVKTTANLTSWTDLSESGYGNLAMQVCMEGDFLQNAVGVTRIDGLIVPRNETVHRNVQLNNAGTQGISSIDYTLTVGGVEGELQHYELGETFTSFGGVVNVKLPFQGDDKVGQTDVTVTVKKVNGEPNGMTEGIAYTTQMTTVDRKVDRRAVVEEFTGLTCGWCPRGIVGMELANSHFGDRFIGIAAHGYSGATSDAMTMVSGTYAKIFSGSAPACQLNRSMGEIDPKYGASGSMLYDIQDEIDNVAAQADVTVSGEYGEDNKTVVAHAQVEALIDGDFTVAFVVTADGLSGTGSGWTQSNYYSQYTTAQIEDPEMEDFCKGGVYGKSSVTGLTFNDAMMASSYVSGNNKVESLGSLALGDVAEREYTITLPTRASLKNALAASIEAGKVYVVALVIDGKGRITNAAKAQVQAAATAIQGVAADAATAEVARYNADGMLIQTPVRGLNIVRMSDGTIRKEIVK